MNGILIIDKPKDYTSRDVVNIICKKLNTKAVGHTGTLDPLATGVLVICIGKATKLVELITDYDKEYIAEVMLGVSTDTLDITGNIIEDKIAIYSKEAILKSLKKMTGIYEQEVPKYSAVSINGKRLYEYARENVDIVLPKRQVEVKTLELVGEPKVVDNKTIFTIKTTVSKGTYIRSLIVDIATNLGTIGTMTNLIRTRQGRYKIKDAITLDQLDNNDFKLMSIADSLSDIKQVVIDLDKELKIKNGNPIANIYETDHILFVNKDGEAIALYHQVNDLFKPQKMFI